jgi:CBS domain containing-hemolysin-like protein
VSSDAVLVIALVALFLVAVLLGAAEAALLRVQRVRVAVRAAEGDRGARRVLRLVDDLPRVMNTVLLVVLLVQIGAATVTGILSERHLGGIGITIASIVLTLLLFVYAEAIPKTYAVRHPLQVSRAVAPLVSWLERGLRPIVTVLVAFADLQAPGTGIVGRLGVTEDELRLLAAEAAEVGEIEPTDAELVDRAFELGDMLVKEILVPRTDVVGVTADTPVREALDVAVRAGHRRLPVHTGTLDDVVGVVRMRDLAAAVSEGREATARELAGPAMIVPETKRVIELLRQMQEESVHIGVVVDEHGGTEGIVTIEDVAAELVGEVADEDVPNVQPIVESSPGVWRVDAATDLDELEDALGEELPHGDWTTVGGLVIALAGEIPSVGAAVEAEGFLIRVTSATPRRVRRVQVTRAH